MDSYNSGPHSSGSSFSSNANKRRREEEDDIRVNEPLRTQFKPDPDAPSTPYFKTEDHNAGTSPSGSANVKTENKNGPTSLANFFEFGSKPLPKLEPVGPTEMGAPLPRVPPQAHYNRHDPAEERSYVNDATVKLVPIPCHQARNETESLPFPRLAR